MIISQLRKLFMTALLILGSALSAAALNTSYYASSSLLSSPGAKWVKVKVTTTGIQEITYQQLKEWFDDPSKVTVYGYGSTMLADNRFSESVPDDLVQQTVYRYAISSDMSRNKLMFYGVADVDARLTSTTSIQVKRNMYSSAGYYFLTDSRDYVAPEVIPVKTSQSMVRAHSQLVYIENEVQNPAQGGTFFFDESIVGAPKTYKLPVTNYATGMSYAGTLIYRFGAVTPEGMTLNMTNVNNKFKLAGSTVPTISGVTGETTRSFSLSSAEAMSLQSQNTSNGTWDISFSTNKSNVSMAAIDYIAFIYPRTNNVTATPQLTMYFPDATSKQNFRIEGGADYTQVWDVIDPINIRPYQISRSSGIITASFDRDYNTSNNAARVVVFNPAYTQYQPEIVGAVAPQNLHGIAIPDMVIVAEKNLTAQAERLADIHRRYQGMDVLVLEPEVIFNEFSSGTPSAMGIRRFAKMLWDRDAAEGNKKFRFLLMFGLGSWDNRHILIPDAYHLLTYQTEQIENAQQTSKCYASDAYFGMLDDNTATDNIKSAMMRINVSRMPVGNASDAAITVDKIQDYFENPPVRGSYNRALLFCDDGDGNDHLLQSDAVAKIIGELTDNVTTVHKGYNALYPFSENGEANELRAMMKNALANGQGYFGYAGHGRADRLGSGQALWSLADIESAEYPISPFTMLSTCYAYMYDRVASDITGHMIRKPGGGAMNIVAACRAVYKQYNQVLNESMARSYFSAKDGDFTGDIFRIGRNNVIADAPRDLAINTLCYNMAGDPAIPIFVPSLKVRTNPVEGVTSDADGIYHVSPLKPFTLSGEITDAEGNKIEDFEGIITIDIYDGPITVRSSAKGEDSEQHVCDVDLDETLLTELVVPVKSGEFTAVITTPVPIRPEGSNRVTYYAAGASTDDRGLELAYDRFASGIFSLLNVDNYDNTDVADNSAPVISSFYLDDENFVSGDEVSANPTVFIHIDKDESGLNVSSGKIGAGAKLVLDGSTNFSSVASSLVLNQDGSTDVSFPLRELRDGYHTLDFSIADNVGNRANASIGFVVINRDATAELTLDASVVRTEAEFALVNSTFTGVPTGDLVIEDMDGNTVYRTTITGSDSVVWDLVDNNGDAVPDGRYTAYAILRSGLQFGNTVKIPVMVVKKIESAVAAR